MDLKEDSFELVVNEVVDEVDAAGGTETDCVDTAGFCCRGIDLVAGGIGFSIGSAEEETTAPTVFMD